MNQSVCSAFMLLLAPLQSSFAEVCRVSTSLLKFSCKLAINHSNGGKFEQDPGTTEQKDSSKNLSKKSFKEGKYVVSIIDDREFNQARK